ncbi:MULTISPECIES: DUF4169 family protein [unclassified Sulfitobacter]|uniref:DUF4169 family protein n=1 Tax=unclassified Sulfitobacter TaxID=196795 RepID=UPI0007C35514|nr:MULTISPECIES: DUF4169 family protein [unclassified Sulfitobacter]KZX94066.1 amidase [Sulfitobacter sp. HI0023]KZY23925.1 amidase [Sulfitobacter sp. HI0040]KZZ67288.1 amidase [Sulfitobacter sp. HI0129]
MSAPINLNKIKKERNRASRRARADENAVQFGQTKAQKDLLRARAEQIARNLEGHRLDTDKKEG